MFGYLRDKWQKTVFSLRFILLFLFISLLIFTTLVIVSFRTISKLHDIDYISKKLAQTTASEIQRELKFAFLHVTQAVQFGAQLVQYNVIDPNFAHLATFNKDLLQTLVLAKGIFYGDEKGNYVYIEKELNNTIKSDLFNRNVTPATRTTIFYDLSGKVISSQTSLNPTYDPRIRPWYMKAKAAHDTVWTNLFTLADQKVKALAIAKPIYTNQVLTGVYGIDISLGFLKQFFNRNIISKNGFAVIMDQQGQLIAYPSVNPFFKNLVIQDNDVINASDNPNLSLLTTAIKYFNATKNDFFKLDYAGRRYLINVVSLPTPTQFHWYVLIVIPESDLIGPLLKENNITFLLSFLILLIGIIFVSRVTSKVVEPIQQLSEETERIKNFDLDSNLKINSNIEEVIRLGNAVNSMKLGLRQFQKYVPKALVRQLLLTEKDIHIGGVRKSLVVFFSDIQNFTSIAEKMNPSILTQQLCAYFEVLSAIIINEKGTIDKYIGDSIMAFWGAPLPEASPCHHAARAALNIIKTVDTMNLAWAKAEKPGFITRIGIHMGDAIVGNVGSSERISYTAIGDTINITSRLEEINKTYKTRIMVSEIVYQRLKHAFIFRFIDNVIVKGRTHPIRIYELLAEKIEEVAFDVNSYNQNFEKGWQAYKTRDWTTAIQYFLVCLHLYPDDTVSPIFIRYAEDALKGKTL